MALQMGHPSLAAGVTSQDILFRSGFVATSQGLPTDVSFLLPPPQIDSSPCPAGLPPSVDMQVPRTASAQNWASGWIRPGREKAVPSVASSAPQTFAINPLMWNSYCESVMAHTPSTQAIGLQDNYGFTSGDGGPVQGDSAYSSGAYPSRGETNWKSTVSGWSTRSLSTRAPDSLQAPPALNKIPVGGGSRHIMEQFAELLQTFEGDQETLRSFTPRQSDFEDEEEDDELRFARPSTLSQQLQQELALIRRDIGQQAPIKDTVASLQEELSSLRHDVQQSHAASVRREETLQSEFAALRVGFAQPQTLRPAGPLTLAPPASSSTSNATVEAVQRLQQVHMWDAGEDKHDLRSQLLAAEVAREEERRLTEQVVEAREQELRRLQEEHRRSSVAVQQTQSRLENLQDEHANLGVAHSSTEEERRALQLQVWQLEGRLQATHEEQNRATSMEQQLEEVKARVAELEELVRKGNAERAKLASENMGYREQIIELERLLSETRAACETANLTVLEHRMELKQLSEEAANERAASESLDHELLEHRSQIKQLRQELAERHKLEADHTRQHNVHRQQISRLEEDLAASSFEHRRLSQSNAELRQGKAKQQLELDMSQNWLGTSGSLNQTIREPVIEPSPAHMPLHTAPLLGHPPPMESQFKGQCLRPLLAPSDLRRHDQLEYAPSETSDPIVFGNAMRISSQVDVGNPAQTMPLPGYAPSETSDATVVSESRRILLQNDHGGHSQQRGLPWHAPAETRTYGQVNGPLNAPSETSEPTALSESRRWSDVSFPPSLASELALAIDTAGQESPLNASPLRLSSMSPRLHNMGVAAEAVPPCKLLPSQPPSRTVHGELTAPSEASAVDPRHGVRQAPSETSVSLSDSKASVRQLQEPAPQVAPPEAGAPDILRAHQHLRAPVAPSESSSSQSSRAVQSKSEEPLPLMAPLEACASMWNVNPSRAPSESARAPSESSASRSCSIGELCAPQPLFAPPERVGQHESRVPQPAECLAPSESDDASDPGTAFQESSRAHCEVSPYQTAFEHLRHSSERAAPLPNPLRAPPESGPVESGLFLAPSEASQSRRTSLSSECGAASPVTAPSEREVRHQVWYGASHELWAPTESDDSSVATQSRRESLDLVADEFRPLQAPPEGPHEGSLPKASLLAAPRGGSSPERVLGPTFRAPSASEDESDTAESRREGKILVEAVASPLRAPPEQMQNPSIFRAPSETDDASDTADSPRQRQALAISDASPLAPPEEGVPQRETFSMCRAPSESDDVSDIPFEPRRANKSLTEAEACPGEAPREKTLDSTFRPPSESDDESATVAGGLSLQPSPEVIMPQCRSTVLPRSYETNDLDDFREGGKVLAREPLQAPDDGGAPSRDKVENIPGESVEPPHVSASCGDDDVSASGTPSTQFHTSVHESAFTSEPCSPSELDFRIAADQGRDNIGESY